MAIQSRLVNEFYCKMAHQRLHVSNDLRHLCTKRSLFHQKETFPLTSMHSSRMRTGCACAFVPYAGGSALGPGWGGRGVCFWSWGCQLLVPGRVSAFGPGGYMPACNRPDPPMDRITDTSKNITLRPVNVKFER